MDVPSPKHVPGTTPEEDIPSYYDRPALKPSLYGWTVGLYMFVGGLAAGTQILVTAIEMMAIQGSAPIVFWGRIIAFSGAFLGGILLIADLHTKQRFYNMLQIFRPTSPMSIGTYVLMSFGFWSLVSLALQWLGFAVPATICGALASVAGWFMASFCVASGGDQHAAGVGRQRLSFSRCALQVRPWPPARRQFARLCWRPAQPHH